MSPDLQLSIIIPTYKRLPVLKETYDSLICAIQNIGVEIIIINDDKAENAQAIAEFICSNIENTIIVNNQKSGVAAARNFGASLAKSNLLLFLDDDVIIQKQNFDRILELHQTFDNIILSPTWVYTEEIYKILESTPFGRYRLKYDYPATTPTGAAGNEIPGQKYLFSENHLSSFCLSLKKEIYENMKGMDESFPFAGCEDQDFTARAKKAGYQLILDESNVLFHNELHRLNPDVWLNRQYSGVQGFVILAGKMPERKKTKLWYENTPIAPEDNIKLKMKKYVKSLLISDKAIELIKKIRLILEKANAPYPILEKIYHIQTGIYINKGFMESYKKYY